MSLEDDMREDSSDPTTIIEPEAASSFPVAEVREPGRSPVSALRACASRFWWVTAACILVTVVLVLSALSSGGPGITIYFQQGHGIKPGDALRYRGTDVGRVVSVELDKRLEKIGVDVALAPNASAIAREGSRFWIERPQVSLARIRGLETVVGAKYLRVIPGPPDAPAARVFEGMERPLLLEESAAIDISIHFREGHGLGVGDTVRHRGIVVGEVASVTLDHDLSGVMVEVRLATSARRLAKAGSKFWIERPQVSFSGVKGLDTIVGGRYIAVAPGPEEGESLTAFQGLERAPAAVERVDGGLEIILEGSQRKGLDRGVPVSYRGIQVGHIISLGLSTDAATVEARAYIRPAYVQLIRSNTRFWNTSGIDLQIGWGGVTMDMDSLATVAAGGVALSTPDSPGALVTTGHRFRLHDKPVEEWFAWSPQIPLGNELLPQGLTLPQPRRASLRWSERTIGFTTTKRRVGWVLPLENGFLFGPADLLIPAEYAVEHTTKLEVGGRVFSIRPGESRVRKRVGLFPALAAAYELEPLWPLSRVRTPKGPEDCLVIGDAKDLILPLAAGRLHGRHRWTVDPSISLDEEWHGACVLSRDDGRLIGCLLIGRDNTEDQVEAQVIPVDVTMLQE